MYVIVIDSFNCWMFTETSNETVESLTYDPVEQMLLWTDGLKRSIRRVKIDHDHVHVRENSTIELVHFLEKDDKPRGLNVTVPSLGCLHPAPAHSTRWSPTSFSTAKRVVSFSIHNKWSILSSPFVLYRRNVARNGQSVGVQHKLQPGRTAAEHLVSSQSLGKSTSNP